MGINTVFINLIVPLTQRPISRKSFLIKLATPHPKAGFISIYFLNVILLSKCTPKYLTFLLVLTTLPYTVSSPYKIKALLLLKTIASILVNLISNPSSLTSSASLLASLSALNKTYLNISLKALTAMSSAYPYLFPFPFLVKTLFNNRLNNIGNTKDP